MKLFKDTGRCSSPQNGAGIREVDDLKTYRALKKMYNINSVTFNLNDLHKRLVSSTVSIP